MCVHTRILLTKHIAKRCKTALGAAILLKSRYVDDILGGDNNKDTLWEAILDIEQALRFFDFSFKHVYSSNLHHVSLNAEGGTDDQQFSPDDILEVVFHHTWFFREDVLQNIPSFFPGKRLEAVIQEAVSLTRILTVWSSLNGSSLD